MTVTAPRPTAEARAGFPQWAQYATGVVLLLALFEIVPRLGLVAERYLPPLHQVVAALIEEASRPLFWFSLYETLRGWAIGLAIAAFAAITVGVVIGMTPFLRAATHSTIEFLRPIPSVALIPLAVLLFGADLRSKLLLIVYASFWQILIQVLYGVQDVDPVARDTARSYRFSRWGRVRYVVWPTALPYVMTGLRLASAVALVLAVTGELIIGAPGLGQQIALAQSGDAVPTLYALVVVTGFVGLAVNTLARWVERRVLSWHPSVRGEAVA
ncbi:ABC transporter permease [Thermopolyspora sp. NPDC052614]|uniref:ABC transporter permease n=1 Tax=Thermopolyspora sp. NPDC052614 TaxID=3155682 RepID=UPI00343C6C98